MKKNKDKQKKQKKARIILPTPTNLAKALFLNALPQILEIWIRETDKTVPFDEWLVSIYNNHAESEGAPETALDYNAMKGDVNNDCCT